jgi:hypothetical protein
MWVSGRGMVAVSVPVFIHHQKVHPCFYRFSFSFCTKSIADKLSLAEAPKIFYSTMTILRQGRNYPLWR